jgi:hypothetical protein
MSVSPKITWMAILALLVVGGCKNSQPAASSAQPNASNPQDASSAASGAPSGSSSSAQQPAPQMVEIPAGTILHVTIDQPVSSKSSNAGEEFDASLAESVRVQGEPVLPRGTRLTGVVTSAKSAGRFKGHAELGLALESINLQGQNYRIHTSIFAEASKGRGKRTGIGAGGGAAFGAIIGAIAGGGKGAAIGAVAGGGAGTAGAAFTGKRDIEIPAETRLSFRLESPVSITPQE